jgi:transcriptional regulator with XRE-family HTH domain
MMDEWESDLIEELKDPVFKLNFGAESAKSEFGLVLCNARQKVGLTQMELSRQLEVSQPYIAKLERGEANPTLSVAGKILAVLGLRLEFNTAPLAPQSQKSRKNKPVETKTAYDKPGKKGKPVLVSESKKSYREKK